MSEIIINKNEVKDHISMSIEEYTKKRVKEERADLVSRALAVLKLAAQTSSDTPIPISI